MPAPETRKALVLHPPTSKVTLQDLPTPTPAADQVLIRVHAIALNPVDALYVAHPIAEQDARVIGTDFAGVVESVGASVVPDERTRVGARVAGFLQGACSTNDRPGAFTTHLTTTPDLTWSLPPGLTFAAAASMTMCGLTAAQGVFERLAMPCPFAPTRGWADGLPAGPVHVLVYGASTSLGLYIAQLVRVAAAFSGREVRLIGLASARTHALLAAAPYAYDTLVDYRDGGWVEAVKAATGGKGVGYALDCISEGETVYAVESCFGDVGRLATFRSPGGGGYDQDKLRVKAVYGAVWEGLGVEIGYNNDIIPASPSARAFAAAFFTWLGDNAGTALQANPLRHMPGGLERVVQDGLALMGANKVSERAESTRQEEWMRPVSAEKLVYSLVE